MNLFRLRSLTLTSRRRPERVLSRLLVLTLLATPIGCSPKSKPQSANEKNLQALSVFYGQYISRNKGQTPPNEEAFKKFLKTLNPAQFEAVGLDQGNLDAIFTSPRDNQPYGIAWKLKSTTPGAEGAPMVIWEQTGVNGKRFVADSLGKIEEIDEAAFNSRLEKTKKLQ